MTLKKATHNFVLWIAMTAFVWSTLAVSSPMFSMPIVDVPAPSEETVTGQKSGCGQHVPATSEETDNTDDENCGDDTVSCVSCKVMNTASSILAAKSLSNIFDRFFTTISTRSIKPALDPPRI